MVDKNRDFNSQEWSLPEGQKITLAEYIWIDGTGKNLRSKTKVIHKEVKSVEDLEWWTYDGSSTKQATTHESEIWLKPVSIFPDPFRRGFGILVMCETFLGDMKTPARGNFRTLAAKIMDSAKDHEPWFGIEQEYFLFTKTGTTHRWPLGWPEGGFPYPQGRYYCGIGDFSVFGRAITEAHLRACLYAGVKLAGLNAEVAPGQWEYQVGITEGIECGDHVWMARYILLRLGEEFGLDVIFEPKPITGDWNGSGCHTNYSTKATRQPNGIDVIINEHLPRLKERHLEHILVYGEGNKMRLTGSHETSSLDAFSYGEGHRGASIRIPVYTTQKKSGYYEDRRPASNIDPYLVSSMIVDTTCLDGKFCKDIVVSYKEFRKHISEEEEKRWFI